MARIYYSPNVTEIKGKVAGSVFQKNMSGYIIRNKGSVRKKQTVNQNKQQQQFLSLAGSWNGLSLSNKQLWNTFARANPHITTYNQTKKLTSYNWFQLINQYKLLTSQVILNTPPTYSIPSTTPNYYLQINESSIQATLDTPFTDNDLSIFFFVSNPSKRSSGFNIQNYRLIKIINGHEFSTYDLTSAFQNYFGVNWSSIYRNNNFNLSMFAVPVLRSSGINGLGNLSYAGYTPPFSPLDVAGCICWYNSEHTINDSHKISQITDLSGNNLHLTQPNQALRPSLIPNVVGSIPGIEVLQNKSCYFQGYANQVPLTLFFVWKITSSRITYYEPSHMGILPNTFTLYNDIGPNTTAFYCNEILSQISYVKSLPYSNFVCNEIKINGNSSQLKENNIVKATGNLLTSALGSFGTGTVPYGTSEDLAIDLEILMYDNLISDVDSTKIYNYLNSKYSF
jgi:hypothetical protein